MSASNSGLPLYGGGEKPVPGPHVRAAFIGTGNIVGVHLNCLRDRKDVEIVGLCDIDAEALSRRHVEYGGEAFDDFDRMLDTVKPDAVWLCTPPQVREAPLLACAERGLPVFCEKPVARVVEDGASVAAALRARAARVQVGYVFRSVPIVQHAIREMADDRIHLVQSFYGCNVSLSRSLPGWFYDKSLSGGALIDQATHNLDILRLLIGEVTQVCGAAANPVEPKREGYTIDEALALSLVFENGAVGSHCHTWVGDGWRNEVLLSGEKRVYRLGLGSGTLTVEEGSNSRTYRQDQGRMYEHQNARFLEMVTSGDWSSNPCSFDEGVATLELTLRCDAALVGTDNDVDN